jgi:hypothetical protein
MDIEEIVTIYAEVIESIPGSASGFTNRKPVSSQDIKAVEAALSFRFPASVRYFVENSPYAFIRSSSDLSDHHSIVRQKAPRHEEWLRSHSWHRM